MSPTSNLFQLLLYFCFAPSLCAKRMAAAIQSGLQRNRAALLQESLKIAAIPQVSPLNRTGESVLSNVAGKFPGVFLWRAQRSPVSATSSGECNAITNR